MDLLSALAHELGHLAGLDDEHAGDVMGESLGTGTRRRPTQADMWHGTSLDVTRLADTAKAAVPAAHRRPTYRR